MENKEKTRMNVGLIDIDRKPARNRTQIKQSYPTLTLMKLAAWHKAKGDNVSLIGADDYLLGGTYSTRLIRSTRPAYLTGTNLLPTNWQPMA